ncbi:hypothetical protein PENTCL1PPCAC_9864 [Pristionchus entomophagus]|uniref:RING-type domain-containing protein n=1 Tax=Pristionchus entomophagus TaxID=358040 RepID=A0AAV5T274_9BILA|nr:hypothetical protein PENTCL1PPCAC_9864 [Pristionchus entomophagus]
MPARTLRPRKCKNSIARAVPAREKKMRQPVPNADKAHSPTPAQGEQLCSICLDVLSSKRSLSFKPCTHSFHRTCAITWLESRHNRSDHNCPNCRQHVEQLRSYNRPTQNMHIAFGNGQPSCKFVLQIMKDLREKRLECVVKWLKAKNRTDLATVHAQRRTAEARDESSEYLGDINDEIRKLNDRGEMYDKVMGYYRRSHAEATDYIRRRMRNGDEFPNYEADTFDELFPYVGDTDGELEVFREAIDKFDQDTGPPKWHSLVVADLARRVAIRRVLNPYSPIPGITISDARLKRTGGYRADFVRHLCGHRVRAAALNNNAHHADNDVRYLGVMVNGEIIGGDDFSSEEGEDVSDDSEDENDVTEVRNEAAPRMQIAGPPRRLRPVDAQLPVYHLNPHRPIARLPAIRVSTETDVEMLSDSDNDGMGFVAQQPPPSAGRIAPLRVHQFDLTTRYARFLADQSRAQTRPVAARVPISSSTAAIDQNASNSTMSTMEAVTSDDRNYVHFERRPEQSWSGDASDIHTLHDWNGDNIAALPLALSEVITEGDRVAEINLATRYSEYLANHARNEARRLDHARASISSSTTVVSGRIASLPHGQNDLATQYARFLLDQARVQTRAIAARDPSSSSSSATDQERISAFLNGYSDMTRLLANNPALAQAGSIAARAVSSSSTGATDQTTDIRRDRHAIEASSIASAIAAVAARRDVQQQPISFGTATHDQLNNRNVAAPGTLDIQSMRFAVMLAQQLNAIPTATAIADSTGGIEPHHVPSSLGRALPSGWSAGSAASNIPPPYASAFQQVDQYSRMPTGGGAPRNHMMETIMSLPTDAPAAGAAAGAAFVGHHSGSQWM